MLIWETFCGFKLTKSTLDFFLQCTFDLRHVWDLLWHTTFNVSLWQLLIFAFTAKIGALQTIYWIQHCIFLRLLWRGGIQYRRGNSYPFVSLTFYNDKKHAFINLKNMQFLLVCCTGVIWNGHGLDQNPWYRWSLS